MNLEDRIMAAVQDVWLMRRIRAALAVRLVAMGVVAAIGGFYVSYSHILANLATTGWHISALGTFVADAFAKTEFVVKTLLALAGVLGVMLLWDAGRFIGFLATRIMGGRETKLARVRE